MPSEDKIDPRLSRELARLDSAGQADLKVPILIQLAHDLGPLAPTRLDQATEAHMHASRRDLLNRLAAMGVGDDLGRLELANALETHLTSSQIREIASHPDVKHIIWNREELLTADPA